MTQAPFVIAPAIDVLEGRCVRLRHGEREHVTVEGGDPAAAARRFAAEGATLIHLVDLDGAFSGAPTGGLVARVAAAAAPVPLQVGGGLRSADAVEAALAAGAARVLVGTAALSSSGVRRLVVTSTRRDGSLEGPDLELLRQVMGAGGLPVLAAGGIATLDDLRRLRELGCEGAIVGSALWLGRFTLAEALTI